MSCLPAVLACRPEANFSSLEALITRINKDGEVSKEALSRPELECFAADSFLQPAVTGFSEPAGGLAEGVGLVGDQVAAADVDPADEMVAVAASS